MIISRTPLRVSFLGGGSDLPSYYRQRGGAVLSAAIDKSVYVTVSPKFDNAVRVSYSRTEEVAHAANVEHPLVRESLGLLGIDGGVEITSVADIPAKGTGLGSSSSFTVGLLNALHAYRGRYATASDLAQQSCQIEIERCGEPIGKQDQYAAAYGGFNFIRFNPDDSVEVKKVLCKPELIADLQARLMFFYSGITRSASTLLREQSAQMARCKDKHDGMSEMVRLPKVESRMHAGVFPPPPETAATGPVGSAIPCAGETYDQPHRCPGGVRATARRPHPPHSRSSPGVPSRRARVARAVGPRR